MKLLWRFVVLVVASFATNSAHPYGVKGGSGGGSAAGALAGSVAGSGALGNLAGSGSFSKSASASFAASSASSGSYSFSESGAGALPGIIANAFNFPQIGGCASGKCENGNTGNSQGLSPSGASSISAAGAPGSGYQPPCAGNCMNKNPQSCQGPNCNSLPTQSANEPEPNDISVNFNDNKQAPNHFNDDSSNIVPQQKPDASPCGAGSCGSKANSSPELGGPLPSNNPNQKPNCFSGDCGGQISVNTNSFTCKGESCGNKPSEKPGQTKPNTSAPKSEQPYANSPYETRYPSYSPENDLSQLPPNAGCQNGKCGENLPSGSSYPSSPPANDYPQPFSPGCQNGGCSESFSASPSGNFNDDGYSPKQSSDNNGNFIPVQKLGASPCGAGSCGSKANNLPPLSGPSLSPNPKPNCLTGNCGEQKSENPDQFPCEGDYCGNKPGHTEPHYPSAPQSQEEPVYSKGFGGPPGILKPYDYSVGTPSDIEQSHNPKDSTTFPSSPNKPNTSTPTDNGVSLKPTNNEPQRPGSPYNSPLNNGKSPKPNSKPQNPMGPDDTLNNNKNVPKPDNKPQNPYYPESPYDIPVTIVTNNDDLQNTQNPSQTEYTPSHYDATPKKSPRPNTNPQKTSFRPSSNEIQKNIAPDIEKPTSVPPVSKQRPTNPLPEPSRLLTTPKETPPLDSNNDSVYSSDLPSSYNVPINPSTESSSPEHKNNEKKHPTPDPVSTFGTSPYSPYKNEPSTVNNPTTPSCEGGKCRNKGPDSTTSTMNDQLPAYPTEYPNNKPSFDVRYTENNYPEKDPRSPYETTYPSSFSEMDIPQPSTTVGCQNGECGKKFPNPLTGSPYSSNPLANDYPQPSSSDCQSGNCGSSFPTSPTGSPYPLGNNYPQPPSPGCQNGKCGNSLPSFPSGNPYLSNQPANFYPQTSSSGCQNGRCGGIFPSTPTGSPSPSNSPANDQLQPFSPGCQNGRCSGSPYASNIPAQPSSPACQNGKCGGFLSSPTDSPFLRPLSKNENLQPSSQGCQYGECGSKQPNSPAGNSAPFGVAVNNYPQDFPRLPDGSPSFSPPAANDYPQPSVSGCQNGQCGSSPNSPTYNRFSPSSPLSNYPQQFPSGCQNGNCGENVSNSAMERPSSSNPIDNNNPRPSSPGCQKGKCEKLSPSAPTGSPNHFSGPTLNGSPTSDSYPDSTKCPYGICGGDLPASPIKPSPPFTSNTYSQPIPSGCLNGQCAPHGSSTASCTSGKCSNPISPSLPSKDEPVYSGGFGGPSGVLKPFDYSASNPQNPGQAASKVPSVPFSHLAETPSQNPSHVLQNNPDSHFPGQTQHPENRPNHVDASSPQGTISIVISDTGAYIGGFGGPTGFLKPFDGGKGPNPKKSDSPSQNEAPHNGLSSYEIGVLTGTGSYSGNQANGCSGGCPSLEGQDGSGSMILSGSLRKEGLGLEDIIVKLAGAAASAKSIAGVLAGAGSGSTSGGGGGYGISGSFAGSSASASSGSYKGGYGR